MSQPREGVPYYSTRGHHRVLLSFDAVELQNIAYLLPCNDLGAKEMLTLAAELDRLDNHTEENA